MEGLPAATETATLWACGTPLRPQLSGQQSNHTSTTALIPSHLPSPVFIPPWTALEILKYPLKWFTQPAKKPGMGQMTFGNNACNEPLMVKQWSCRYTWQYIVKSSSITNQEKSLLHWSQNWSLFNFLSLHVADCGTPAPLESVEEAAELEVLGAAVSAATDWPQALFTHQVFLWMCLCRARFATNKKKTKKKRER